MLISTNFMRPAFGLGLGALQALGALSEAKGGDRPSRPKYTYADGGSVIHRRRSLRVEEEFRFRAAVKACVIAESKGDAQRAVNALPRDLAVLVPVRRATPIVRGKTYAAPGQGFGTSRVARHRRRIDAAGLSEAA